MLNSFFSIRNACSRFRNEFGMIILYLFRAKKL